MRWVKRASVRCWPRGGQVCQIMANCGRTYCVSRINVRKQKNYLYRISCRCFSQMHLRGVPHQYCWQFVPSPLPIHWSLSVISLSDMRDFPPKFVRRSTAGHVYISNVCRVQGRGGVARLFHWVIPPLSDQHDLPLKFVRLSSTECENAWITVEEKNIPLSNSLCDSSSSVPSS